LVEATSTKGTNDAKGTGPGYMICKKMIERNGGTISVKSELRKSASISFILLKYDKS
jgi:signal transduction histidine kinase